LGLRMHRYITKDIFLKTITCPRLGWLVRYGKIEKITQFTLGEKFRIEQGLDIGKRARELYPDGFLVNDRNIVSASAQTKALMQNQDVKVIFESTFWVDGYAAKADILKREDSGWHLIEVKSSINDKREFIDDIGYTSMVLNRTIDICKYSLLLISKNYRLGMGNEQLFVEVDHTDEVRDRIEEFAQLWEPVKNIIGQTLQPKAELRFECRKCLLFNDCLGKHVENHVFDLPRLSKSKFKKLTEQNIFHIENISSIFPLTKNQTIVKDCVQEGKNYIGESLRRALESIIFPAYYLDFETVMTAIPLYPDIPPYTSLPTQYSIHKCSKVGNVVNHSEYLADPDKDCRREIAENLIKDLDREGSIIIYSSYEKTTVNNLIKLYSDLCEDLESLKRRMVDLEKIIRKNFYHPDFHGSYSIKKTLPVLVPDMTYDGMEIPNGDTALVVFALLARGKYRDKEAEVIKKNLLAYCKLDTLAMVKLHHRLEEYM